MKISIPVRNRKSIFRNLPNKNKKATYNMSVFFGHENFNLVLNMMIGCK